MTRLEQIEFENEEKFMKAISTILKGEEAYRTYEGKDKEPIRKKIISKNKLYLGNFGLKINKGTNNKIYLSIDYFSFDDRMAIHNNKDSNKNDI